MSTLSTILVSVNAFVDLEAAEPTGSELTLRTNYANQAVREWASAYQWPELTQVYTAYASGATLAMPSTFREFLSAPRDINQNAYIQIAPEEAPKRDTSDMYMYLTGNRMSGFTATFNQTSGATFSMTFQRYASGFATLTDICEVPDPEYVKMKVASYILQSRSDDRFPTVEATANTMLQNMIGRRMRPLGGGVNTTPRRETYVMGE